MRKESIVLPWTVLIYLRIEKLPSPYNRRQVLNRTNEVNALWNKGEILKAIQAMNRLEAYIDELWEYARSLELPSEE